MLSICRFLNVAISFIAFLACNADTTTKKNTDIEAVSIERSIEGHYQFFTTGYTFRCESIKHEFDFTSAPSGGTFLYHVFCHPFNGDSTGVSSSLKPYSMIGKWQYTEDSSIIRLLADNGTILKVKIYNGEIIGFYDEDNRELAPQIYFHSVK